MSSTMIFNLILSLGIVLVSLLILTIPLKTLSLLTTPFSMRTFGIRKIKRWHSRTDTLANLMIWITVIFCIIYPFIPYSPIIWAVWITFTWLCALARAVRLTAAGQRWKKLAVIFCITVIYGFGLLGGLGLFNHYSLWIFSFQYANSIAAGEGLDYMYYLSNVQPFSYLAQMLIMIISGWNLWGQFKYMRLENTFKAANMFTYIFKFLITTCIVAGISIFGQSFLEDVYQTPAADKVSSTNSYLPMDREEAAANVDKYKAYVPEEESDGLWHDPVDTTETTTEEQTTEETTDGSTTEDSSVQVTDENVGELPIEIPETPETSSDENTG